MIRYEFEYFSFLIIAVLFSAGNAKKNVFTVFTVPIATIGRIHRGRTKWKSRKASIVTIGSMKTVKTFFLAFPALNSTALIKKSRFFFSDQKRHFLVGFTITANGKTNKKKQIKIHPTD